MTSSPDEPLLSRIPPTATSLGHSHWYLFISDSMGSHAGIIQYHLNAQDRICGGAVLFRTSPSERERPTWTVVALAPLTLKPSIRCTTCGDHGFIEKDRWRPA